MPTNLRARGFEHAVLSEMMPVVRLPAETRCELHRVGGPTADVRVFTIGQGDAVANESVAVLIAFLDSSTDPKLRVGDHVELRRGDQLIAAAEVLARVTRA